jgi:hypothetical protein
VYSEHGRQLPEEIAPYNHANVKRLSSRILEELCESEHISKRFRSMVKKTVLNKPKDHGKMFTRRKPKGDVLNEKT